MTDTEIKRMKQEAHKFRVIRTAWFLAPTIAYSIALLICFICNLTVNHTLSWFFVVFASLVCAYTFVPTVTCFFKTKKLLSFVVSTCLSICLVLFTCAVYNGRFSWLLTSCIGVLIGYVTVFAPILLSKSRVSRYKFVISFTLSFVLTVVLLLNTRIWHAFDLVPAITVTSFGFMPIIACAVVCSCRFDAFIKAGTCTIFSAVVYYFLRYAVNALFVKNASSYEINFHDWNGCLEGNVCIIVLAACLLVGTVFIGIGVVRICKGNNLYVKK